MKKTPTPRQVKKFDNAKVVHDGIVNSLLGAGGRNDKRQYSAWTTKAYTLSQLTDIYRSNWIARRVVDIVAEDITGKWRSVYFGEDAESAKAFQRVEKSLKLKKVITNAIKESRLYGTSFILIGSNSATLDSERPDTLKNIDYLTVLNSGQVVKDGEEIEDNYLSSGFGYPKKYQVQLKSTNKALTIHNSWLIRVDATYTPTEQFKNGTFNNDSALTAVMDAIERFEMGISSAGQLLTESSIAILKSKRLAELLTQTNGKEKAQNYFWESMAGKSVFKTTIIDAEDEMIRLNAQLAGIFDLLKANMMEVSGATEIPLQRLFGETQTGLSTGNNSSDRIYYDGINRKREDILEPILDIFDPIILNMIGKSGADFESELNPLWTESQETIAKILQMRASALVQLIQTGAILPSMALKDLIEEKLLSVSEEDIATIEEMDLNYEQIKNRAQASQVSAQSPVGVQSQNQNSDQFTNN